MSGIRSFLLRHRLGTPSGEVCSTGSATYGYLFRLVRFESLILSKTGLQSFISWTTKAAGLIILLFLLSLSKGLICLFIGLLHRGIAWTSFFINIDQKLARKQLTQIPLAILLKALRWTLEGRVGEEGSIAGLSRQFPRTQDYK